MKGIFYPGSSSLPQFLVLHKTVILSGVWLHPPNAVEELALSLPKGPR
jgi:hypothetical protein